MLGHGIRRLAACVLFASGGGVRGVEIDAYRQATPGYQYSFPRDHFEHPEFRTEWWYYTGNIRDAKRQTIRIRAGFLPAGAARGSAPNPSSWRVDEVYLAHLALTDIDGKHFYNHQRLNRAGPGIAGASFQEQRVWNGNWSAVWHGDKQLLEATADEFHFQLGGHSRETTGGKWIDGVSQKGNAAGEASYYVSFTRLLVSGDLTTGSERLQSNRNGLDGPRVVY